MDLESISNSRQIPSRKADDLISTMLEDHEQTPGIRFKSLRSRAAASKHAASPMRSSRTATRSDPEASLMTKLWRAPTIKEELDAPIGCLAIRKSHWIRSGIKCANTKCKKQFRSDSNPRNCSMCGELFCRPCTNYNRNLSINARPDSLGHPHHVCLTCYNHQCVFGVTRDQMGEFQAIRKIRVDKIKKNEAEQRLIPLCSRRTSETKVGDINYELQNRLLSGYKANLGKIKGIVSELVVPEWQKSPNWVKESPSCSNCGTFFSVLKRKFHCRVGGQIFCSKCSSDELILYVDDEDGDVNWAMNGKEGGLRSAPKQFRLLSICQSCSTEMEAILRERESKLPRSPSLFQDSLQTLHSQLSRMQATIETNLPAYRDLVECMYVSDHTADGNHPMRKLVKAHSDLSDAFSSFAVESQKLKQLEPKTDMRHHCQTQEEKLLGKVMMGMYLFYHENMSSFRLLRNSLSEHVPLDTLAIIQAELSLQSMERFHVLMQQLVLEAINLQQKYKIKDDFLSSIIKITQYIDVEFQEFIERRGDDWERHNKLIVAFVAEELKNKRQRIKINDSVHYPQEAIQYLVVSQCSSLIHELYRELQAKTVDKEFKQVKSSLYDACIELDTILVQFNTTRT